MVLHLFLLKKTKQHDLGNNFKTFGRISNRYF